MQIEEKIKAEKFSVLVDESTDVGSVKSINLGIVKFHKDTSL